MTFRAAPRLYRADAAAATARLIRAFAPRVDTRHAFSRASHAATDALFSAA